MGFVGFYFLFFMKKLKFMSVTENQHQLPTKAKIHKMDIQTVVESSAICIESNSLFASESQKDLQCFLYILIEPFLAVRTI